MRVDDGVVVPALSGTQTTLIEFANTDYGVLRAAIDLVTVDVKVRRELVVLAKTLKLGERIGHQRWVDDTNVRGCRGVFSQRAGLGIRRGVVGKFLDL